jgi:O-antigen/teichoic acid export membrane protein
MEKRSLKAKVLSGLFWKLMEQGGSQGIQFVVALVLARLMTPEEYGTIGLITIFITIANTFVQSGFATSLIQQKEVEEEDYSSVFWISMLLALGCYGILFFGAPWIAGFYHTPVLTPLVRVMGIVLFPGAMVSIQTAYVARNLKFEMLFSATMAAVVLSGAGAILLAMRGAGVWAMAAQQILYYFVLMGMLLFTLRWYPKRIFRSKCLASLFSFGWKILLSGIIDTVWQNVYGLVIGKKYSNADLGTYNRGEQFPKIIATNLSTAIQSVMLPAYAKVQDEPEKLRHMTAQSIRLSAFFVFPMMAGLIAVARPLVLLLLTEKWLMAAPYLCIMALCYAVYPMHIINLQVMNAVGRSDLFLKLEIIKKALGMLILVLSLPFGIWPMLMLKVFDEFLCTVINAWPNRKLIQYGPARQWLDVMPSALCSVLMAVPVYMVERLSRTPLCTLLIQMVLGVVLYLVTSFFFNREPLLYAFRLAGVCKKR